jgi:hypothetical protein
MACYKDGFTFYGIDDIRTSQERRLLASMACSKDGFTCYGIDDIRTSQETHYGLPWPVTNGFTSYV